MTAPMSRPVTRRRVLGIVAASAAALVPGSTRSADIRTYRWTGTALGADASISLHHPDRAEAQAAVDAARAEIERLEDELSLYRPHSALSRLNREGRLDGPSVDMRVLLSESVRFGNLSGGAFDVTVQPLWHLHADHFAAHPDDAAGPPETAIAAARALVDYRRIRIGSDRIDLEPGMAVTLNGIAQGYITDRVADVLRARGFEHVLLNLGETRALNDRADGSPWTIAIADPRTGAPRMTLPLTNRAVASSAGAGTAFDRDGRHHHLFSPTTGRSGGTAASVTVVAERATDADALATAAYVMTPEAAQRMLQKMETVSAWTVGTDGRIRRLT